MSLHVSVSNTVACWEKLSTLPEINSNKRVWECDMEKNSQMTKLWQQKHYKYHTIKVSIDYLCSKSWLSRPNHVQIWFKILTFDTMKIILLVTKLYWWRPYYEIVISVKTNNPHKPTLSLNHPPLLEKIWHSLPSLT